MGSLVVKSAGPPSRSGKALRSLTLANTRTGVKTTCKEPLRNPLPANLRARMWLGGFAVEGGVGELFGGFGRRLLPWWDPLRGLAEPLAGNPNSRLTACPVWQIVGKSERAL